MTDRHPWRHEPRKPLTDQQKARLFLERGCRCHRCKRKLGPSDTWSDEHIIALENGGTNAWENRDISCSWCKPLKDAEDHKKAAKGRHVATSCIIPRSQRRRKGRPMPGSKASGWKRTMSGEWVRR